MRHRSPSPASRGRARRLALTLSAFVLGFAVATVPATAEATPREDMRKAYAEALRLFNDLELDQAIGVIDSAIGDAESGTAVDDPVLASLYLMKAALLYSNEGEEARSEILAAMERAVQLNYHVVMPLEVRSEGLTDYLNQARSNVGVAPNEPIGHSPPSTECGEDIQIEALLTVPDGGQAAVYWRRQGTGEYLSLGMNVFSNVAEATISASEHQDANIQYFIYAFDAGDEPVANLGTESEPLELDLGCIEPAAEPELNPEMNTGPSMQERVKKRRGDKDGGLPRFAFNLGLGTGGGLARGQAEKTFQQFFPTTPANYTYGEHACAIARFTAESNGELPSTSALFGNNPANPPDNTIFAIYGPPGRADDLAQAYNAEACAEHHNINTGVAWAPFSVAPELQFRLASRITLSVFGRLQLVTGSKVYRDNNTLGFGRPDTPTAGTTYWDYAYTASPPMDFRDKTAFTWAAGLKFRYYFGQDDAKLRPFAGVFGGYGQSRLRVNMGFANDLNGNSVPDNYDWGWDEIGNGVCVPVWPYVHTCDGSSELQQPEADMAAALYEKSKQEFTSGKNRRIDTVVLGPGFAGAMFGVQYQIIKNVAFFAEIQIGGWFGANTTVLADLNLGPVLTF